MERSYDEYRQAFADQRFPLGYVDLEMLEENARQILARAAGLPIRIATKSLRSTWLLRHLLDLDDSFQGLMCFSAAEAIWLADQGFDDLLMGQWGPFARPIAARARHFSDDRPLSPRWLQYPPAPSLLDDALQSYRREQLQVFCLDDP